MMRPALGLVTLICTLAPLTAMGEPRWPTIAHTSPTLVQASERWGISDLALLSELEAQLLNILEGPIEPSRSGTLSDPDRLAIEADSELHEAYRSAPAATLALIKRIRDAGGLTE